MVSACGFTDPGISLLSGVGDVGFGVAAARGPYARRRRQGQDGRAESVSPRQQAERVTAGPQAPGNRVQRREEHGETCGESREITPTWGWVGFLSGRENPGFT